MLRVSEGEGRAGGGRGHLILEACGSSDSKPRRSHE